MTEAQSVYVVVETSGEYSERDDRLVAWYASDRVAQADVDERQAEADRNPFNDRRYGVERVAPGHLKETLVKLGEQKWTLFHLEGLPCPVAAHRGIAARNLLDVTCVTCIELAGDWLVARAAELAGIARPHYCGHRVVSDHFAGREYAGKETWECERAPGHAGRHGRRVDTVIGPSEPSAPSVTEARWQPHVGGWRLVYESELELGDDELRRRYRGFRRVAGESPGD